MKKLLKDRESIRLGVAVAVAFPLIYSPNEFPWLEQWDVQLVGHTVVRLVQGVIFWFCMASFRRFRDEDVTPR